MRFSGRPASTCTGNKTESYCEASEPTVSSVSLNPGIWVASLPCRRTQWLRVCWDRFLFSVCNLKAFLIEPRSLFYGIYQWNSHPISAWTLSPPRVAEPHLVTQENVEAIYPTGFLKPKALGVRYPSFPYYFNIRGLSSRKHRR